MVTREDKTMITTKNWVVIDNEPRHRTGKQAIRCKERRFEKKCAQLWKTEPKQKQHINGMKEQRMPKNKAESALGKGRKPLKWKTEPVNRDKGRRKVAEHARR
jgi:hypothetical protein